MKVVDCHELLAKLKSFKVYREKNYLQLVEDLAIWSIQMPLVIAAYFLALFWLLSGEQKDLNLVAPFFILRRTVEPERGEG